MAVCWCLESAFGALLLLSLLAGWFACKKLSRRHSFIKACVWGSGWSTNEESEPQGWLNVNYKTSWSLKWINGSDIIGICLCQGFYPRPATFPRLLSSQSGDTSFTAQRRLQMLRRWLLPSCSNWGKMWLIRAVELVHRGVCLDSDWLLLAPQVLLLFFSFKFHWFYVWLS